ncbi:polysaccharide pyruvyl transferase family protein [Acidobacteria bacterium AH-259-D05]|nr:polysaccharide pyruvyl transferase family protein [Acidobacteria bacterium AH-259-D05]
MEGEKSIVIHGYYGFNNTGDELILSVIIQELARHIPSCNVKVVSKNPDLTRRVHQVEAVTCLGLKEVASCIRSASLIIMGGGGLFHDYWLRDNAEVFSFPASGLPSYGQIPLLAKLYGKPLIYLALGVGPIHSDEATQFVRFISSIADRITVRDKSSRDLLLALHKRQDIQVAPDPVFAFSIPDKLQCRRALAETSGRSMDPDRLVLGVCLRPWGPDSSEWVQKVAKGISLFLEKTKSLVCFIPFQDIDGSSDVRIAREVAQRIDHREQVIELAWDPRPSTTAMHVGGCDLLLGMRFHSIILSAVAGNPVVALAYDPKIDAVMDMLGQTAHLIPWHDFDPELISRSLVQVTKRREEISAELTLTAKKLAKDASGHFFGLEECVEVEGETPHAVLDPLPEIHDHYSHFLAERQAHYQTQIQLAEERQQLAAEREAHNQSRKDLLAVGNELAQERQQLTAEREAHNQTYERLLTVGDELVQERQQLATERQVHSETLRILREVYASRGWRWLERYRKFKKMVLLGTMSERWNYFQHLVKRFVPNWRRRAPKNAGNHFRVDAYHAEKVMGVQGAGLPIPIRSSKSTTASKEILRSILDSHPHARAIVVYPPTVDWNYPLFQRPHHIALGLAQCERVLLYMSPNLYDNVDGARSIGEALYVVNLPLESFQELPREKTVLYLSWAANYWYSEIIPHRIMIYDYLDTVDLSDSPSQKNVVLHASALKKADIVFTTAKNLYAEAKKVASKVILCPNGAECEHFDRSTYSIPDDLQHVLDLGKPIIGYYGAVASWLDYSLLKTCAVEYPDWEFVLIGLDYDGSLRESGVTAMPNVHYLGSKSYGLLPHYLHGFSVATIPFCVNQTTLSTSPIKLFEYMAGGKPVVTTALPECNGYKSVLWSGDQNAYLENLARALELSKDEAYLSRLKEDARNNSWDKRVRQIVAELSRRSL